MADYDDSQSVLNSMQYLGSSINSAAANITTAQLDKKNREWYEQQYQIMREYNNHQREMAQEYNTMERLSAQQWAEEMWNMTFDKSNDYNSPANQMHRMQAAGINPNAAAAMIGGGVAAGQSVPSSSGASSPSASSGSPALPPLYNPAEAQASMMNANANAAAQFAQADLSKSMARKTEEETEGIIIDNSWKPFEKDVDYQSALQNIELMVAQGELNEAQAESVYSLIDVTRHMTIAQRDLFVEEANQIQQNIANLREQKELLTQQIETEKQRRKNMKADEYEAYMNAEAAHSMTLLNGKKGDLTDAEKDLREIEGREAFEHHKWRQKLRQHNLDPDAHGASRIVDNSSITIAEAGDRANAAVNKTSLKLNSKGTTSGGSFRTRITDALRRKRSQPFKPRYTGT